MAQYNDKLIDNLDTYRLTKIWKYTLGIITHKIAWPSVHCWSKHLYIYRFRFLFSALRDGRSLDLVSALNLPLSMASSFSTRYFLYSFKYSNNWIILLPRPWVSSNFPLMTSYKQAISSQNVSDPVCFLTRNLIRINLFPSTLLRTFPFVTKSVHFIFFSSTPSLRSKFSKYFFFHFPQYPWFSSVQRNIPDVALYQFLPQSQASVAGQHRFLLGECCVDSGNLWSDCLRAVNVIRQQTS